MEVGASDDVAGPSQRDALVLKRPLVGPLTDADQPGPERAPRRTNPQA